MKNFTMVAMLMALTAVPAYSVFAVDPLLRYQEYIGVGGTAYGGGIDYNWYLGNLGCKVLRVHLEKDDHVTAAVQAVNAARAQGEQMTIIGSIWTPPGDMKIGPFYSEGNCVDGYNMCGGTLDPAKYNQFADWVVGRLDRFKNAGAPLSALCLQNEPWLAIWYISCIYDADQYVAMIKNVVPPVKTRYPDLKIIAMEMWSGSSGPEMTLVKDPQAAALVDIFAWHGSFGPGGPAAGWPGATARGWKGKHGIANYDKTGFRPVWQTENNLICGWLSIAQCDFGGNYTSSGIAFEEAANVLAMFRYGHGQVWTCYGVNGELQDTKRQMVYKHYGKYLKPGAEMIACQQDSTIDVATVAFHHKANKTLTIVTVKGGTASQSVSFTIPGYSGSGRWYLTDANVSFSDKGTVSAGQSVTLSGNSLATFYFENYNPDISAAVYPLDDIGSVGAQTARMPRQRSKVRPHRRPATGREYAWLFSPVEAHELTERSRKTRSTLRVRRPGLNNRQA